MSSFAVTRVINASVLLELPGGAVLTDPFFEPPWYLRFDEPVGLSAGQLPPLAALVGGHRVADHWQPRSLRSYPYREATPVYVASRGMARSARRAGFGTVEVLRWGERRRPVSDLEIVCLPGERAGGLRTNSYLVSSGGIKYSWAPRPAASARSGRRQRLTESTWPSSPSTASGFSASRW